MMKLFLFPLFVFLLAVSVLAEVPDLSKAGEHVIPALCMTGPQSKYEFKIGENNYVLTMSDFENLEVKYPQGYWWKIGETDISYSGIPVLTTDSRLEYLQGYMYALRVNGEFFGQYAGPRSELKMVSLVQGNTLDAFKKIREDWKSYADSSYINGVLVRVRHDLSTKVGEFLHPDSNIHLCATNLVISSPGTDTKAVINPLLGKIIRLSSGIPQTMSAGAKEYTVLFREIKDSSGKRYDLVVTPEETHNSPFVSFRSQDLIEGKMLTLTIPLSKGQEAVFLFRPDQLFLPKKQAGSGKLVLDKENKYYPKIGSSITVAAASPLKWGTEYSSFISKTQKSTFTEGPSIKDSPFPPLFLDVLILGGRPGETTTEKQPAVPPTPGVTGAVQKIQPLTLPKEGDLNGDGKVNQLDVEWIKNNPGKMWTDKLNGNIFNLKPLIEKMKQNWS